MRTTSSPKILSAHQVVAGQVNEMATVLDHPHVAARQAIATVMDDVLGPLRMPAPVPRLSETPGAIRHSGGAPGADNAAVFARLGLDPARLARLTAEGIIGQGAQA